MERPGQQRLVGFRTAPILIALEQRAGDVELAEHVAQAARQRLLELQLPAQQQHRGIRAERQGRRVAVELAIETAGVGIARGLAEAGAGQAEPQRPYRIGNREADVAEQVAVELAQPLALVLQRGRLHLLEHPRMAEDRALAEDHQRARHDVRAFHGDRDRRGLPRAAQIILRAQDDALAAVDVHRVLGDLPAHLGAVVLGDGRGHRGQLAASHRRSRSLRQRADRIGVAGDTRECLLHAFETADRQAELLADPGIRTGRHGGQLGTAAGGRGQGDGATNRQALHQHLPALAGICFAADQLAQRDEDLAAAERAVLERTVEREVAAADVDPGRLAWQQRQADADVALVAEDAVRVVHAERHADQRSNRRQGDVALVEGQLDADHVGAIPVTHADDAEIGDRGRIRTRPGAGEGEAGHFAAVGQAGQVMVLLFLGAVMHQQLGRPEGVGHADGGADHGGNGRQLLDDLVVAQCAEAQAAVFLRHDHPEELVLLDELPHLRRQVRAHVGDVPVVGHPA